MPLAIEHKKNKTAWYQFVVDKQHIETPSPLLRANMASIREAISKGARDGWVGKQGDFGR
jgi:hypothetical protein